MHMYMCVYTHTHIYYTQGLKPRTTGKLLVESVSKRWSENQVYLPVYGCNSSKLFVPKCLKFKKLWSTDCSYLEFLTQSLAME